MSEICLGSRVRLCYSPYDGKGVERIAIVYEIKASVSYKDTLYYTIEDDGHCGGRRLHDLAFVEDCSLEELLTHISPLIRRIGLGRNYDSSRV